ncbi:major facilitator superfamily MFS_1 [Gluconacetobacter diazotrophicus PA1 5]|uniref:MFS transporter n=1 Tax=Gluconacetobacter diazotrophicus TaxID=33996 RepID=UPI000173AF83|nr:MFS transporter [Gluconacetobacter diazotrophicus]ACI50427.1 major facilitator superfamily MFS_1 [Gluconacetobacter diazotrophicus PA1 5]TWB08278.1 DHA1 family inner membrane transport protein [Gluconacetobacter diazotrophicus]
MPLPLLALALASFGIGTTEFVIMGLLPQLADNLGVSIPAAGQLVSGYALGVTVGAPIVAVATAPLRRKTALLVLMAMFIVGNFCCAVAPTYLLLMAARVMTAFCHGAFFGTAAIVAADLVPRNKRAQALSLVFAGLTLANVFGVPFGTALGQWAGWRATFWAVCAIGVVALLAIVVLVPGGDDHAPARVLAELRVLRRRQVLLTMLISTMCSASLFSVFTYITPLLQIRAGLSPQMVTVALLLFGAGITIGNLAGGRLADWVLLPSVIMALVASIVVLVAFVETSHFAVASMATLFLWGIIVFALVPPLQYRVVQQAAEAPNMASTLNQGAFNLGNAVGAWIGGLVVSSPWSYGALPVVGAVLALAALLLVLWAQAAERGTVAAR